MAKHCKVSFIFCCKHWLISRHQCTYNWQPVVGSHYICLLLSDGVTGLKGPYPLQVVGIFYSFDFNFEVGFPTHFLLIVIEDDSSVDTNINHTIASSSRWLNSTCNPKTGITRIGGIPKNITSFQLWALWIRTQGVPQLSPLPPRVNSSFIFLVAH